MTVAWATLGGLVELPNRGQKKSPQSAYAGTFCCFVVGCRESGAEGSVAERSARLDDVGRAQQLTDEAAPASDVGRAYEHHILSGEFEVFGQNVSGRFFGVKVVHSGTDVRLIV